MEHCAVVRSRKFPTTCTKNSDHARPELLWMGMHTVWLNHQHIWRNEEIVIYTSLQYLQSSLCQVCWHELCISDYWLPHQTRKVEHKRHLIKARLSEHTWMPDIRGNQVKRLQWSCSLTACIAPGHKTFPPLPKPLEAYRGICDGMLEAVWIGTYIQEEKPSTSILNNYYKSNQSTMFGHRLNNPKLVHKRMWTNSVCWAGLGLDSVSAQNFVMSNHTLDTQASLFVARKTMTLSSKWNIVHWKQLWCTSHEQSIALEGTITLRT